jgi:hypothetical protein
LFVKNYVFFNLFHDLSFCHLFAGYFPGFGIADFYAFPALYTQVPNGRKTTVYPSNCVVFAERKAIPAADASIGPQDELFIR